MTQLPIHLARLQGIVRQADLAAIDKALDRRVLLRGVEELQRRRIEHAGTPQAPRSDPEVLLKILEGRTDAQNVACAQSVLCNEELAAAVEHLGHPEQATLLRVVGAAFEAFDARGLTSAVRTQRLKDRSALLLRLVGDAFYVRQTPPSHFAGLSARLVKSWLANAAARLWVLGSLPAGQKLCERALSSDSVEGAFSALHGQAGFKPQQRVAVGVLDKVDWVCGVGDTHVDARGFHVARDVKAATSAAPWYACHQPERSDQPDTWNDGSALDEASVRVRKRSSKAAATAAKKARIKTAAVRSRAQYRGANVV